MQFYITKRFSLYIEMLAKFNVMKTHCETFSHTENVKSSKMKSKKNFSFVQVPAYASKGKVHYVNVKRPTQNGESDWRLFFWWLNVEVSSPCLFLLK